ncbi:MAG: hypothetical protein ACI82S_002585 [Patiriisocius sp.]|jgi:hypothetical protein
MLFLEGAISENPWGGTTFTRIKAPSQCDMVAIVHTVSQRIARYLKKVGLVERDMENSYLNLPLDDEVNPDGQFTATPGRPSGLTRSAIASLRVLNKGRKCLLCKPYLQAMKASMVS